MNELQASRELPRYRCHKEVWALKIKAIEPTSQEVTDSRETAPTGAMIFPEEAGYAPFHVDQRYMEKHQPEPGGYYVVYKDGYKSFSPAEAFEDGYTLIK
jgi:hypothetical protein